MRCGGLSMTTALAVGAVITLVAPTGPASATPTTSTVAPAATDWSRAVVDSTMRRFIPATLGGWSYTRGLYLYGQYLVYQRTHEPRYLRYIKDWVDRFVDASGTIDNSFNNLDSMQSGNLLLILFTETGDTRYRTAAAKIRARLNTYPRTDDGGFWHATSRQHQLWLDGTFMVLPFLIRYGQQFNDATFANNEAANQLLIYGRHTARSSAASGLFFHAYDEDAAQSWVVDGTHHSPEPWCRAMGWFGMAHINVLELLPADHPQRAALIAQLKKLISGWTTYQDPASGRWFQVVDKGGNPDNWTETSCSAMYTFTIAAAVQRGYVPATFQANADRGYAGVLQRVSTGGDGLTDITQISEGTNVGNLAFYLARARNTNDFHGLGAFLIMNELLQFGH